MNLENKVVLVTGSSGGLGAQICYEAAKKGAIVIACARRSQLIDEVKAECQRLSGKEAYAFPVDVSYPDSVDRLYEQVMQTVGRVDMLVNNAGFGIFEDFLTFDLGKAYDMFEVNVLGMMVLTQKFAIDMAERRQGHIINIASMAGGKLRPRWRRCIILRWTPSRPTPCTKSIFLRAEDPFSPLRSKGMPQQPRSLLIICRFFLCWPTWRT